jgi:riboflavin synthase
MFTGIVECLAKLEKVEREGTNVHLAFSSPITGELKIDQSVAHNGCCLTVVENSGSTYRVTAIDETMKRTNLGTLKTGDKVNLERCVKVGDRLDGHIVQGHVDAIAKCVEILDHKGSKEFVFDYDHDDMTVEKGSVTVNGVSLTVVRSEDNLFSVHIIPYTLEHTNFGAMKVGSVVNIEFDIVGKYVRRLIGSTGT